MPSLPLYWWKDEPNFGDAISPWLMEQVLRRPVHWSRQNGKFVGLGSVLWAVSSGDIVWGTGLHPFSNRRHPNWSPAGAMFLAVRGPITREYILSRGGQCPPRYGDPAELLPHYHVPSAAMSQSPIGIIPHIYDCHGYRFASEFKGARTIDPRRPWEELIGEIVASEIVWSSSLHGIIIAEAYGVPAVWVRCSEGELKYLDYYAATGRMHILPCSWDQVSNRPPPALPPQVPLKDHPLTQTLHEWQMGIS